MFIFVTISFFIASAFVSFQYLKIKKKYIVGVNCPFVENRFKSLKCILQINCIWNSILATYCSSHDVNNISMSSYIFVSLIFIIFFFVRICVTGFCISYFEHKIDHNYFISILEKYFPAVSSRYFLATMQWDDFQNNVMFLVIARQYIKVL